MGSGDMGSGDMGSGVTFACRDSFGARRFVCLVHPPGCTNRTSISAPTFLEFGQVMLDPSQDRCMRQRDASVRHHDHQISQAQLEAGIPADTG
jgi:hypothetical protein